MRRKAAQRQLPPAAARTPRARARRPRRRLAPDERRRALLRAATDLMNRQGVDGVQFAEVAAAGGVTRPLVYRFFPTRQALIIAVLEDFAAALTRRFGERTARAVPATWQEATRLFVDAVCDTIEEKGAGPWYLLDSKGPDPEVARYGRELQESIVAPWRARIAELTGVRPSEVATVSVMVVAAGRAVLEQWCQGALTREQAVRAATRGVSALLAAFTNPRPTRG